MKTTASRIATGKTAAGTTGQGPALADNRAATVKQRKMQVAIADSPRQQAQQLNLAEQGKSTGPTVQRKGSHGKNLFFRVSTVVIENAAGVKHFVNINYQEDLGKIPTHGQGPAQKTQAYANAIAQGAVHLAAGEVIKEVNFDHFSRKS